MPSFSNRSIFPLHPVTHSPTPLFVFCFFLLQLYTINFLYSLYFIFFFPGSFPANVSHLIYASLRLCLYFYLHLLLATLTRFHFPILLLHLMPFILFFSPPYALLYSTSFSSPISFHSHFHPTPYCPTILFSPPYLHFFFPTLILLSSCSSYSYPTSSLIRLMLYFTFLCAFSPRGVIVPFSLLLPHLILCLSQLRLSFSSLTLTSVASDRRGHSLTLLPVSGCAQGCCVVCRHL